MNSNRIYPTEAIHQIGASFESSNAQILCPQEPIRGRGKTSVQINGIHIRDITYSAFSNSITALAAKKTFQLACGTHYTSIRTQNRRRIIFLKKADIQRELYQLQHIKEKASRILPLIFEHSPHPTDAADTIASAIYQLTKDADLASSQKQSSLFRKRLQLGKVRFSVYAIRTSTENRQHHSVEIYIKTKAHSMQPIGKGAFKKVVKVIDVEKMQFAAMAKPKSLGKGLHLHRRGVKNEYRFAQFLQKTSVPYVIPTHSLAFYTSEKYGQKTYAYFTEYCSKGNLFTRLRSAAIPHHQQKKWALQLCQSIHAMHERGFLHRDIKCENILIGDDGDIRIIDFEFMAAIQSAQAVHIEGTLGYFPPEILSNLISGKRQFLPYRGFDIWCIGCVLYHMKFRQAPSWIHLLDAYEKQRIRNKAVFEQELMWAIHRERSSLCTGNPFDKLLFGLLNPNPSTRLTLDRAISTLRAM